MRHLRWHTPLRCGACGSGMSVKDRMGRLTRIMCTRAKESRSCTNVRPYALDHIEATVIDGLRARLNDKALIDHYVAAYNDEHQKLYSGQGASRKGRPAARRRQARIRPRAERLCQRHDFGSRSRAALASATRGGASTSRPSSPCCRSRRRS
ncbi:zinc ribbon domain-containing protein [Mesorhizobium sp. M0199]|uniref:zinc ribbon domain-containing protein n=1 Tax=unclassified Mesorhizobium TaxID=325217 RepID=UPI0033385201